MFIIKKLTLVFQVRPCWGVSQTPSPLLLSSCPRKVSPLSSLTRLLYLFLSHSFSTASFPLLLTLLIAVGRAFSWTGCSKVFVTSSTYQDERPRLTYVTLSCYRFVVLPYQHSRNPASRYLATRTTIRQWSPLIPTTLAPRWRDRPGPRPVLGVGTTVCPSFSRDTRDTAPGGTASVASVASSSNVVRSVLYQTTVTVCYSC